MGILYRANEFFNHQARVHCTWELLQRINKQKGKEDEAIVVCVVYSIENIYTTTIKI